MRASATALSSQDASTAATWWRRNGKSGRASNSACTSSRSCATRWRAALRPPQRHEVRLQACGGSSVRVDARSAVLPRTPAYTLSSRYRTTHLDRRADAGGKPRHASFACDQHAGLVGQPGCRSSDCARRSSQRATHDAAGTSRSPTLCTPGCVVIELAAVRPSADGQARTTMGLDVRVRRIRTARRDSRRNARPRRARQPRRVEPDELVVGALRASKGKGVVSLRSDRPVEGPMRFHAATGARDRYDGLRSRECEQRRHASKRPRAVHCASLAG
jgi:hypothetical protein